MLQGNFCDDLGAVVASGGSGVMLVLALGVTWLFLASAIMGDFCCCCCSNHKKRQAVS
jgi:hypothetical protein